MCVCVHEKQGMFPTYMYTLHIIYHAVYIILIKGAIARVVRIRTGNGPMALVNIMFPLWSCSLSLTT